MENLRNEQISLLISFYNACTGSRIKRTEEKEEILNKALDIASVAEIKNFIRENSQSSFSFVETISTFVDKKEVELIN